MSRNRFQLIQKYLHFNDNNAAGTNEDHLYKIRTILDIVVNNCRTYYIPDREFSLHDNNENNVLLLERPVGEYSVGN